MVSVDAVNRFRERRRHRRRDRGRSGRTRGRCGRRDRGRRRVGRSLAARQLRVAPVAVIEGITVAPVVHQLGAAPNP